MNSKIAKLFPYTFPYKKIDGVEDLNLITKMNQEEIYTNWFFKETNFSYFELC